jgi:hypothetical protein
MLEVSVPLPSPVGGNYVVKLPGWPPVVSGGNGATRYQSVRGVELPSQ